VSAPILLSTFVKSLSRNDLPPSVEEHRIRLRRFGAEHGSISPILAKWDNAKNGFHAIREEIALATAQADEGPPKEVRDRFEEKQRVFFKCARDLSKGLEEASERIIAAAPTLESYDDLVQFFRLRRVYCPEPFAARDFVKEDERTNDSYKQILLDAANFAYEKARGSFSPNIKRYNWIIGILAFLSLNSFGISIVMFRDNPIRLSIGLLLCFDILLAVAYVFYRMSRSKEFQLKDHIKRHVEAELKRARSQIACREEERYKGFLEEERIRREAWEKEQDKRREAFDRVEAQRLESIQPLMTGKTNAIQAVLSTLFPFRLPVPCGVTYRIGSANRIEITLQLPDDQIFPPEPHQRIPLPLRPVSTEEDELSRQCTTLAASLAIRHAAEILFNVPTCNNVVIKGTRKNHSVTGHSFPTQVLHAEIDRKTLEPMGRTVSPMNAIKRFKHRFSSNDRVLHRSSA